MEANPPRPTSSTIITTPDNSVPPVQPHGPATPSTRGLAAQGGNPGAKPHNSYHGSTQYTTRKDAAQEHTDFGEWSARTRASGACMGGMPAGSVRGPLFMWALLLALAALCCRTAAAAAAAAARPTGGRQGRPANDLPYGATDKGMAALRERYTDHPWHVAVTLTNEPLTFGDSASHSSLFVKGATHEDLAQLYDENLALDLAPWRARGRANVSIAAMAGEWMAGQPAKASQRVVVVRGGRVLLVDAKGHVSYECERPCDRILYETVEYLKRWVAQAPAEWPDVAFFLNAGDNSACPTPGGIGASIKTKTKGYRPCPAPALSVIKEWGPSKDEDILVPLTLQLRNWKNLVYFPTQHKLDVAFFRGREYCHLKFPGYALKICSRRYLAFKSELDPDWSPRVDVGLASPFAMTLSNGSRYTVADRGYVPAQDNARFRYSLALDGITASSRLARLLTINSPVLKQASPWIEWYYRSMAPGVHYIPFWEHSKDDLLYVMRTMANKTSYLEEVALQGQAFAYRYLTPHARMLYWQRVLTAYRELVGDMDEYLFSLTLPPAPPPPLEGSRGGPKRSRNSKRGQQWQHDQKQ